MTLAQFAEVAASKVVYTGGVGGRLPRDASRAGRSKRRSPGGWRGVVLTRPEGAQALFQGVRTQLPDLARQGNESATGKPSKRRSSRRRRPVPVETGDVHEPFRAPDVNREYLSEQIAALEAEIAATMGNLQMEITHPEADALMLQAVDDTSPNDVVDYAIWVGRWVRKIMALKPSKEWVWLQGHKGCMAKARAMRALKHPELEPSYLKGALDRAKAIRQAIQPKVSFEQELIYAIGGGLSNPTLYERGASDDFCQSELADAISNLKFEREHVV